MSLKKICLFVLIMFIAGSTIYAQTNNIDSLSFYRRQIDSLDNQLIEVLGKRMEVVENIGYYKAKHNMPALQQNRFDAILQKNIALGKKYGLSGTFITELMNAIHKESLAKENAIGAPAPGK